jgi:hypothetical protein
MKRLVLILAVLVILPVAVFADFGVGGAAFYRSPVLLGQSVDTDNLNVDQFSFGGDARIKVSWFQAEALVLYAAGDVNSLAIVLDAGVALDIAIVRLSIGAGPNLTYNFGESSPAQAGLNAKIGADIILGPVSAGLSYIMMMNVENGLYVNTGSGFLGAQVLFWM